MSPELSDTTSRVISDGRSWLLHVTTSNSSTGLLFAISEVAQSERFGTLLTDHSEPLSEKEESSVKKLGAEMITDPEAASSSIPVFVAIRRQQTRKTQTPQNSGRRDYDIVSFTRFWASEVMAGVSAPVTQFPLERYAQRRLRIDKDDDGSSINKSTQDLKNRRRIAALELPHLVHIWKL
nr:hypothetical protein Iba_chr11bCG11370 [Ipomoea batatas]